MRGRWADLEQESSQRTRKAVLLGALVAVGVLAVLRLNTPAPNEVKPTAATAAVDPEVLPSTVIESAPEPSVGVSGAVAAGRATQVGVYECVQNGQRVASDRPCGADAEQHTLTVSQPDPRDAIAAQQRNRQAPAMSAPRYTSPRSSAGQMSTTVNASSADTSRCAAIDREIDAINARMRQGGYGTAEGNWLRGRWHQLKNERYQLRCGR